MSDQQISSSSIQKDVSSNQVAQSFKSKTDFMTYFKTNLQLYCPPIGQLTKEWIRMILSGEKRLMKLNDIKAVNVGHYPEVSVKALYEEYLNRPEVKIYLPNDLPKGRQLDKTYFFTIINTLYNDEIQAIIKHANVQRNAVEEDEQKKEAIVMSEEMAELMFKFPFQSKAKGRTVHLLKNKSKRIRASKPKKKYDVLNSAERLKLMRQSTIKRRSDAADEDANMGDQAQQRKKIVPMIIEKFDEPKNKK